jgi:hypothetical protein
MRAEELGLKVREATVPWTADEDAALRASCESGKTWRGIAEGLPRRTRAAVETRAVNKLGLKRQDAEPAFDARPQQLWQ